MSGTEIKHTRVTLQIEENEKWWQEQAAKLHGLSYSALLRGGARLKGSFSPGFLDELGRSLEDTGITVAAFIELGIQRLIASQAAWQKVFGSPAPGIMRQFRWDGSKLVRGDDLSKILEAEYTELFEQMKDSMVVAAEGNEAFEISQAEAFELTAQR